MKYLTLCLLAACSSAAPLPDAGDDSAMAIDAGPDTFTEDAFVPSPDSDVIDSSVADSAPIDTGTPLDVPCSETTINCFDNPAVPTCHDAEGHLHPECVPACSDAASDFLCDSAEGPFCVRPDSVAGCVPR